MKVAVLGAAGGIGQALSLLLKNNLPADTQLALYDIAPVTPGVAVDLSHIPSPVTVKGYAGTDSSPALQDADVVIISAGVARKPGMTRADLFNVNAGIIKILVGNVAKVCPNACVGIITNPVNTVVPIAAAVLKKAGVYNKNKLFGITSLDVLRTQTFVADLVGKSPLDIKASVIGGHSGVTILPLLSQIEGVSLTAEQIDSLTTRIQNAGTEVVEAKAGGGSATLSMGQAASRFTCSLVNALLGKTNIVECAYVESEENPQEFFAQPVLLGKAGLEKQLGFANLSHYEQEKLAQLQPVLKDDIQKGLDFAI